MISIVLFIISRHQNLIIFKKIYMSVKERINDIKCWYLFLAVIYYFFKARKLKYGIWKEWDRQSKINQQSLFCLCHIALNRKDSFWLSSGVLNLKQHQGPKPTHLLELWDVFKDTPPPQRAINKLDNCDVYIISYKDLW
jgi:hypothetical protein